MFGTLKKCIEDMENGVTDFTKEGKCSGCGQCCSAVLPLSKKELERIKKYVNKNGLKPHEHSNVTMRKPKIDLTCPFLDNRKEHKCDIYEVRPEVCRNFICNVPPSKVESNREKFWKNRDAFCMWDLFERI